MLSDSSIPLATACLALAFGSQTLRADIIDFSYYFPLNGVADQVIGSGQFTTTPLSGNQYTITGISGSRTVEGITDQIASLLAPNAFGTNDNLLFASGPSLDGDGVSFLLNTGGGDNGMGDVNVFYDASLNAYGYTEASSQVGFGAFTISPEAASVPEPLPPTFAVLALLGALNRYRRKA